MNAACRPSRVALLAAVVAVFLGSSRTGQTRADTLQLADGTSVRGEIKTTSPDEIAVETKEGQRKIAVGQIRRILLEDEPTALRSAREAMADGQFDQALQSLERISREQINRPLVAEEVEFYRASARSRLAIQNGVGETEAAKVLLAFLGQHPKSMHFYEAAESLGDLARRLGRLDKAAEFYGKLKSARWSPTKYRGLILEADCLRAADPKNAAAIISLYDQVLQAPDTGNGADMRRLKELAKVGKAFLQIQSGQTAPAMDTLKAIIDQNDAQDIQLFGRAYLALGNGYLASQQWEDALLAFLHVDLLFADDPENHAEALHHLVKLWDRLGNHDRAADARNRLKTRYTTSRWAK